MAEGAYERIVVRPPRLARWEAMDHTLKIDVPKDLYERLAKKAQEAGRTPEEVAGDCLRSSDATLAEDALLQLAGSFESGVRDAGERHDHYLGQALIQELRPERDG